MMYGMKILPMFNRFRGSLLALAFVFSITSACADGDHSSSHDASTINVSGSAAASAEPNELHIRFGVETQQPTSIAAMTANSELMNAAVQALRDVGLTEQEFSTAQFSIQPVYDSIQDPATGRREQTLSGYRVRNVLAIATRHLDLAADILDSAAAAGVNRVDEVRYALSGDKTSAMQEQLIGEAVVNAQQRAGLALAPLQQKIVGVQNVVITGLAVPTPQRAAGMMMEMARSAPTPVFSGDQDVQVSVNVTFLISPE